MNQGITKQISRHYNMPDIGKLAREAYAEGRRLVAPLMGFPGVRLTGRSIKMAQQNYGEHYRAIRELALRFKPDVIFPLMDLSVEANANGRYTVFPKFDSATVPRDQFDFDELNNLRSINFTCDSRIISNVEAVKQMSIGLSEETIIGAYVTGPYTLTALILGADAAAMGTVMEKDKIHQLCIYATERIQEYMRLLVSAGAQVVCILEPTAVMLGPDQFEEFSASYVSHLVESFRYSGLSTVYHTCGNTMHVVGKMVEAGVNGVSLDSAETGVDLVEVAKRVPEDVLVIGNVNPTSPMSSGTVAEVEKAVLDLLKEMDPYPNFVLSTGCDLPYETPAENIEAFMRVGREYRINK